MLSVTDGIKWLHTQSFKRESKVGTGPRSKTDRQTGGLPESGVEHSAG